MIFVRRFKAPATRIELPISAGSSKQDAKSMERLLNLPLDDRKARVDWARFEASRFSRIFPDEGADFFGHLFLQSAPRLQAALKECADSWMSVGCSFDRWTMGDRFKQMMRTYRVRLDAPDNQPSLVLDRDFEDREPEPWLAFDMFLSFLLGPYSSELGRCLRCNRYFVNTSGHSNKEYCRQRCASSDSAERAGEEKRLRETEQKRNAIQNALDEIALLPKTRQPRNLASLKKQVASRADKRIASRGGRDFPTITMNYVTRQLNAGRVNIPKLLLKEIQSNKRKRDE